jgi:hypothetical protein
VRGTEFRAGAPAGRAQFEVLAGEVGVGDSAGGGPTLAVAEGEGVLVDPTKGPPQVVKLLAPPELGSTRREQSSVPAEFAFAPVPGARAYRLQLARDATFDLPAIDRIVEEPTFSTDALADGAYWLRVRAIDADGLEGIDAVTTVRISARPVPPLSLASADYGRTRGATVRFAWTQSPDAIAYHFQLAADRAFTSLVADLPRVAETAVEVPVAPVVADYYWRVAAIAADGRQGPYGAVNVLERRPATDTPGTPEVGDEALTVRWNGLPDASYRVQIASDPGFVRDVTEHTTKGPLLTLPKPPPGTYYVRVQAIDAAGRAGAYSDPQRIDIPRNYLPLLLLILVLVAVHL